MWLEFLKFGPSDPKSWIRHCPPSSVLRSDLWGIDRLATSSVLRSDLWGIDRLATSSVLRSDLWGIDRLATSSVLRRVRLATSSVRSGSNGGSEGSAVPPGPIR